MEWDRISNLIIGFVMFGGSLVLWLQGRIDCGKDATLIFAAGVLLFLSLYPLLDAFDFSIKYKEKQNERSTND